jgi:hypothetical protein
MKCSFVYEMLDGIARGADLRYRHVQELVHLGLVKTISDSDEGTAELEELKQKLYDVKQRILIIREGGVDSGEEAAIFKLKDRERELRKSILDMVQNMRPSGVVNTSEGDVTLTYRGREALQILEARLPSANEWEWETLAENIENLSERLASEAGEAKIILKKLSPELKKYDEYLLRSASVGLASVKGEPNRKAQRFIEHIVRYQGIMGSDDSLVVTAAEESVTLEFQNELKDRDIYSETSEIISRLVPQGDITPEHETIATLLISKSPDERSKLISWIELETPAFGNALGAALILLETQDRADIDIARNLFRNWMKSMKGPSKKDQNDAIAASALLATAVGDQKDIEEKFNRARGFMKELFGENMYAISATIAIWPTGIEESFDNIRLAASQILLNKMSVGGVENFSLGIKLLTNNAEFMRTRMGSAIGLRKDLRMVHGSQDSDAMAISAGATGVALLASPLLMRTPFTVFHSLTFQKYAVNDFKYHPVHTNYLYG